MGLISCNPAVLWALMALEADTNGVKMRGEILVKAESMKSKCLLHLFIEL